MPSFLKKHLSQKKWITNKIDNYVLHSLIYIHTHWYPALTTQSLNKARPSILGANRRSACVSVSMTVKEPATLQRFTPPQPSLDRSYLSLCTHKAALGFHWSSLANASHLPMVTSGVCVWRNQKCKSKIPVSVWVNGKALSRGHSDRDTTEQKHSKHYARTPVAKECCSHQAYVKQLNTLKSVDLQIHSILF